jgi:hypothetical protein
MHIQGENKLNHIYKLHRYEKGMGIRWHCHWKSVESWVGTKHLSLNVAMSDRVEYSATGIALWIWVYQVIIQKV